MRVIAGEKRHLGLKTLAGLSIRPTTDKIKETLFNMIQFDVPGKNFLDLFAGSGAIGIEALSRGARHATFVDSSAEAIKVIKENLTHTGLVDVSTVIRADARLSLENLKRNNEKFDIVFMDPPYDQGLHLPIFEALNDSSLIDNGTLIIYETSLKDDGEELIEMGYQIVKVKKYKSNKHIFVKKGIK